MHLIENVSLGDYTSVPGKPGTLEMKIARVVFKVGS